MAIPDRVEPLATDPALISAFEVLGQKWSGIILHTLAQRPARFSELRGAVSGISDKMLSDRLRELVNRGLVTHTRLPPGPVAYALTSDGHALTPVLDQVASWWKHRAG
ncbi:winged helix-turn-helix transcriptional regulator [Streptomyces coffeae]|uniref:winged helix-turn-helix transcriptional regulator n=1 Tax=Streptomyces coffeae TaxID=621382 RepID=UPI0027DB6F0C|nr:helix-turn-helix domain-containing protein [Streptomyces coffeae]